MSETASDLANWGTNGTDLWWVGESPQNFVWIVRKMQWRACDVYVVGHYSHDVGVEFSSLRQAMAFVEKAIKQ